MGLILVYSYAVFATL